MSIYKKITAVILMILIILSLTVQYTTDKSTTEGLIKYGISQIDTLILSTTLILLSLCEKED